MAFIYKKESVQPENACDYAIRYDPDNMQEAYAKVKGQPEFKTDLKENNIAFELTLSGTEISKEEYDAF
jgi:hypothetical protein